MALTSNIMLDVSIKTCLSSQLSKILLKKRKTNSYAVFWSKKYPYLIATFPSDNSKKENLVSHKINL